MAIPQKTTVAQTGTNPADAYTPKPSNNLMDYKDASGKQVLYPTNDKGQQMVNGNLWNPTTASFEGAYTDKTSPDPLVPKDVGPIQAQTAQIQKGGTPSGVPGMPNLMGNEQQQAGQAIDQLKQKYGTALSNLNSSGATSPSGMGAGSAGVQSALPASSQPESPSMWNNIYEIAPEVDKDFMNYDNLMSPTKQRQSLVQEYDSMSKSLGLEQINAELINDKAIIEGTEDDIRNEVMAAGGMATDSQVQAMANARNKSLIKNYNTLLDTKNSLTTQLSTMMQLSVQDRKFAEDEFDRKLNFAFKVQEFKERAQSNATSQFKYLIDNGMGSALLGDPYQTRLVEKTLGLPSGGLSKVVAEKGNQQTLENKYKQAQIDNLYSQIGERDSSNRVVVDTSGKVVVKPTEALKINKELVGSDAYKAIRKSQDSLQFLNKFEETFNETGATSAVFSPRDNAKLKSDYNAAILNLKEFFNLGVLNGPDEAIIKSILPDPTNRSALLTIGSLGIYKPSASTKAGLETMKGNIEKTLDDRYASLSSQYGDYSPNSINSLNDLQRIYIEQKATLNPQIQQMIIDNPEMSMEDIIGVITH